MNIFMEIHSNNPREGPGDDASTLKALSLLTDLPVFPRVLDVGCGPGMQTIALAKALRGSITAVDTHQDYLDTLDARVREGDLSSSVRTLNRSMTDLDFPPGSFDLIWSEGAIYIMGFEEGLTSWKRFLAPGGYLVVSEISWSGDNIPCDLQDFWMSEYPGMRSIHENLDIIERSGYESVGWFMLPESSWWENYYNHLALRMDALEVKYRDNPEALGQIEAERKEMELFRRYSKYYGYVFYCMRKVR